MWSVILLPRLETCGRRKQGPAACNKTCYNKTILTTVKTCMKLAGDCPKGERDEPLHCHLVLSADIMYVADSIRQQIMLKKNGH